MDLYCDVTDAAQTKSLVPSACSPVFSNTEFVADYTPDMVTDLAEQPAVRRTLRDLHRPFD
jgi:hypothetical protein